MPRYRMVPDRSQVWIDARSTLHAIHATSDGLEGHVDLVMDGDEIDVTVPPEGRMALPAARLSSGNRFEDHELRRRLDVRRFPTIEGVLIGVEALARTGVYHVSGDLTFRGVTRRYKDEMRLRRVDGRTIALEGRSTFDVRDFGMEPPRVLFVAVEPVVEVRVEIVAELDGEER